MDGGGLSVEVPLRPPRDRTPLDRKRRLMYFSFALIEAQAASTFLRSVMSHWMKVLAASGFKAVETSSMILCAEASLLRVIVSTVLRYT